ncbi:hypothetical protein BDL97_10G095300 [Sphagnum fallax]|nr:hypothetical protein BDL97_10G095300 [Sphagnum fallax]KAH8950627.1 hypothetical protein BDL97_10G095300 [Sphagnum fallax]
MAGGPAVRRSSSHRWRDQRRRWTFHLQLFVFGFLCFSAFFTVYELSRDGYLGVEYLSQQPQVILHHYESANRHSNFLHSATFQHTLAERDHWSVRVETSSSSGGWVNNNRSGLENSDQQLLSINSRNEEEEAVESAGEVSKITSSMYSEASDTGNREELWNPPQGYNWLGQGFLGKFTTWLSSSEDSEKPNSKLGEAGSVTGSLVHSSMNTGYINKLDGNDGRIPGNGTKVNDKSAEGDKSLMSSKEKTDEEEAHDTHASWPESNKTLTSDQCNADSLIHQSASEFEIPRVIPKCWKPPQPCGTAEEMGLSVVGDTRAASLRVRQMIKLYMLEHGAQRVVLLPGEEFCKRSFVLGHAFEDGFGNNVYKVLTAAGLSLLLNRSLIIGERGATNPTYVGGSKKPFIAFGDYIMFSNETFSMQKVKHLWALHDCAGKYKRPLTMQVDDLEPGFARSRCLCDDWTISPNAILWFKGTSDTVGLQCLLKNANGAMRSVAAKLLGNPSVPNSRPNTFGELLRAFMSPSPDIHHAVEWALKGGPDPDIALHLRMRHNHNQAAIAAASACILRTTHTLTNSHGLAGGSCAWW